MKSTFLQNCAVIGVGAALLFTAASTRADEPKKKTQDSTETRGGHNTKKAKSARPGGKIPTRDGRNSTSVSSDATGGANGEETRVPTGSHLPRTYHRKGYTTDREENTTIIDQNDTRLRESNNVGDALRQVPSLTVGGRR